jgi:hypothetical protein
MVVTDGVAVGNSPVVEPSVVTTGTPTVALLGHDVWCRGSRTLRAVSCAIPQHGAKLGFGDCEPVRGQST